jgi:hypothetical protein
VNQAELPPHRKLVGHAPVLDDLAVLDALDVYLIDLDLVADWRRAEELAPDACRTLLAYFSLDLSRRHAAPNLPSLAPIDGSLTPSSWRAGLGNSRGRILAASQRSLELVPVYPSPLAAGKKLRSRVPSRRQLQRTQLTLS